MKKALMYGAGNIGRGFIGQLFSESGYEVTFLDINKEVIDTLNKDKQYPLVIVSQDGEKEVAVKNVRGVMADSVSAVANEMASCDIMAVSLGANVISFVAENLAEGCRRRIEQKRPLDILICENLMHADAFIKNLICERLPDDKKELFDTYIGLIETSIGRMVPVPDEKRKNGSVLKVFAEEYPYLPVDKDAFKGEIPDIKGLYPYSPFMLFIERKLYMHNMSHALTAYLGNLQNCTYIYEACGISEIRYIAYKALVASAEALSKKYGYPLSDLLSHAGNLLYRFSNKELGDTVERVGKDTIRKLKKDDRLEGTLQLLKEQGIDNGYVTIGIAAALLFAPDSDKNSREVKEYTISHSPAATLEKYSSITDKETADKVTELYNLLKNGASLSDIITKTEKRQNNKNIL